MNFMRPEEWLLLMNYNPYMPEKSHIMTLDERKLLRDAGIQTAIEYPCFYAIEPSRGKYDFSSIENILELNRGAEMKTIFSVPNPYFPSWLPDEWKSKHENGALNHSMISFWSKEGIQYMKDYLNMLINRYLAPDVMFVWAEQDTGESAFPSYFFYEDCAVEDFRREHPDTKLDFTNPDLKEWLEEKTIEHFVEMQEVFYPQYHEIWNNLQWLINHRNPASLNYLQPRIFQEFRERFFDVKIVLLQYTYWDSSHPKESHDYVDMLKRVYDCDVIVEAMFCNGLPTTAPKTMAKGYQGQIICPTHPHTKEQKLESWMVDNIRNANKLWAEMRK
jgi:hypothetical protein